MVGDTQAYREQIRDFVRRDVDLTVEPRMFSGDTFWSNLRSTGTHVWLDTGDLNAAGELWSAEMSALTTNNTLLNAEIQKGIYDELIGEANRLLADLDSAARVHEVAFVVNVRHGLRLVQEFGADVSIELHTALSHDIDGIVSYGERIHEICPERFLVKVPLTAAGLLGARELGRRGVRVNLTLGFSARQNVLAATIARPSYCNVFLGRLGAFVKQYGLGSGENVGEKATIASQQALRAVSERNGNPTYQIAASMRSATQVRTLAGVDVMTMPIPVAREARSVLPSDFSDRSSEDVPVQLVRDELVSELGLAELWRVDDAEYRVAEELDVDLPADGEELAQRARRRGLATLFPELSEADRRRIREDGKLPDFHRWKDSLIAGDIGLDALFSIAGLEAFAKDQDQLDDRIRGLIGE